MRRISHTAIDEESQVDLTPLIDVVFIMLIFFSSSPRPLPRRLVLT